MVLWWGLGIYTLNNGLSTLYLKKKILACTLTDKNLSNAIIMLAPPR